MDLQAIITESDLECMLFDETAEPRPLAFSLLERITNDFSYKMEIGRGGFAVVYKGKLRKGVVAVKRLSNTYMYENEFFREVECLMKVKHKNIVRFLGYCIDTQGQMIMHDGKYVMADVQQRLLCFEYLTNGCLIHYIKDPSCGLDWIQRYDIIKGICEGLHHLHELNIVHLDLKPDNILLDDNGVPKIADFGISRSFEEDQTRVIATKVLGTPGYMAPEFVSNLITKKYDLYSLGVIIMEILTGEKRCPGVKTVLDSWSARLNISPKKEECEQIRVCAEIAIECTDFDLGKRPANMKHIIERLAETVRTKVQPAARPTVMQVQPAARPTVMQPIFLKCPEQLCSLDAHPTETWIVIGHSDGNVSVWNHESKTLLNSFEVKLGPVMFIKFHATKKWIVAGTRNELIHVYDCACVTQIQWIKTLRNDCNGYSVAIHPTKPYVLSASMMLWDGDKGWECTHICETDGMFRLAFNSEDPNCFACATYERDVEVWSLHSSKPNYTLYGHSKIVRCLDFFKHGDQQYLITGSHDCTAKIWDLQKRECIHTLDIFRSPVEYVISIPGRPYLVTCSDNATIYVWSSSDFSLKSTVNFSGGGHVHGLVCLMGSRRIAIGQSDAIYIMDIDDEGKAVVIAGNNEGEAVVVVGNNEDLKCEEEGNPEDDDDDDDEMEEEEEEEGNPEDGDDEEEKEENEEEGDEDKEEEEEESDDDGKEESGDDETQSMEYSPELFDDHPLEYRFYPELSESIPWSLHLTNKTDEHVAFRLTIRSSDYSPNLLYGDVHPRSTCTSVMTTYGKKLAQKRSIDLVLQSCSIYGHKDITTLGDKQSCIRFLEEARDLGHAVYEVLLRDIYTPQRGKTTYEAVRSIVEKPIFLKDHKLIYSMDAHPTEPWIVIGHEMGNVSIWNYESETREASFEMSRESVSYIKFQATKKWIVAVTSNKEIHVYDCVCISQIQKVTSFIPPNVRFGYSVGIHPTKPYVLSASMQLWNGEKGWKCTHTFATRDIYRFAFNPEDPNSFASTSVEAFVEVWNIDSPHPIYTLQGHSEMVNCLAYVKHGDGMYLITGSEDITVKIWDLQKRTCIHTIEGFMSPVIHVISIPRRPYIVTCSKAGTIQVWSSIDFRLKTTVNFSGGGDVYDLACLMGSRRIAIGQHTTIHFMDIADEDDLMDTQENNEDSVCAVGQPSNP